MHFDLEAFGSRTEGFKMNWKDARVLIDKGKMPKIPLSLPQIVFLAMDDFTTSTLATAWYTLTTIVIVVNIVVIILQSLSGYTDESQSWFALINDWCVNIFILEYFTKAFCSMYCPIALFDSAWMLDHVLPYGDHEHLVANSLHTTKWQRLSHWACTVNNVVDFVSITPKLLSVAVSGMHLPLASLRMLRLLRIIRVFRAFRAVGKWVTTLQVLSEAFMSSLGSVFVLVLYIGLFSMVAGAVLYSEEGETDDRFRTVPSAIAYVTERFVGDSFSITETLVGGLVLASVGVFKATIFLLPIERLKTATTAAEAKFQENARFREQIERETITAKMPKHLEWVNDFSCPSVRVRVYDEAGFQNFQDPAIGTLHIPIHSMEGTEALVAVPLHGGRVKTMFGPRPELEINVCWDPDVENTNAHLPKGDLSLQIVRGTSFAGVDTRWRVFLEVPETLYGARATADWTSPSSTTGGPTPQWGEGATCINVIEWAVSDKEQETDTPEESFRSKVLDLLEGKKEKGAARRRVLDMLESQAEQLSELETRVAEVAEHMVNAH